MTKRLFSVIGVSLLLGIAARAEETQSAQPATQKTDSNAACKSKCDLQYPDCTSGTAPMHSSCEMYKQCVVECN